VQQPPSVATERDPVIETPVLSGREHSRVDQDGAAYRDHLASVRHGSAQAQGDEVMREPWFVNEPVAHNCESQASVETERCVPPVGPEYSDVLLPEFSDDVVKELAPDAVAVHCRLHRHEAELHGGNVRRQRAWTRIEACDTRECARAPGSQMPRAG
jgi:hypothetical protein